MMPLELDHIFVCCAPGAPEAEALLRLGLIEGSRNTHPGQGTENRRFFFENAFLELLWVSNPQEAQSSLTQPTRLWERWSQREAGVCPFGIGFRPSGETVDAAPFPTWSYRPAYLPEGFAIQFAEGTSLGEPELFYLAWPSRSRVTTSQPTSHTVPLQKLTSVVVGIPDLLNLSQAAQLAKSAGLVSFKQTAKYSLELAFASETEFEFDLRPTLPVILNSAAA